MNDKKWIILGLLIFVGLFTFPIWYNLGKSSSAPTPILSNKAKAAGVCILPAEEMRAGHMQILDDWRNRVVRNGERIHVSKSGVTYDMSLSNTCLDCHNNREEFCDKCHNYTSVKLYCWDCHVDPTKSLEEIRQ